MQTCLVGIPEEEHGVLKEKHCGDESEVAEAKRKREKIDMKQREVHEEYLETNGKTSRRNKWVSLHMQLVCCNLYKALLV